MKMHLRLTIRDLLWLAALVALAVGWWLDHRDLVLYKQSWHDFMHIGDRRTVDTNPP